MTTMIEQLLKELQELKGEKGATGTPTDYYMHGPGGLFSTPGLDQGVFSTRVKPTGLLEILPAYPTVFTTPLYEYITGFQASTGSEADTPCSNCKQAGIKKACTQTAQFGRYCRETKEFSFERIGQLINRSEPTDLRLLNPLFHGDKLTPAVTNQDPLKDEIAQAMVEVGVELEILLSQQLWNGNPANNNAGRGYEEFPGLAILVGTGKVDAITNTSCPSLDSDIKNYNYQDVCTGTPSIVEVVTYLHRYLRKNASTMQMEPVDFRFAMREELFYELTSCWPCEYITFRCHNRDTSLIDPVGSFDAAEMIKLRDAMRNGKYLLVDGKMIPVVFDDGIDEETDADTAELDAGEFASDIYLLPFSVKGNIASLYLEYFDFRESISAIRSGPNNMFEQDYFVTDNGKFSWNKSKVNRCFLWDCSVKPRVLLRTPYLAGRIQNVKYVPLQHTRQPFPSDGYFVDGGPTYRSTSTTYTEWGTHADGR